MRCGERVGDGLPKVSLDDLFYAQSGDRGANVGYRNRIARKHVDFLLCDPEIILFDEPTLGVDVQGRLHCGRI